jgi:hypothetical protein
MKYIVLALILGGYILLLSHFQTIEFCDGLLNQIEACGLKVSK